MPGSSISAMARRSSSRSRATTTPRLSNRIRARRPGWVAYCATMGSAEFGADGGEMRPTVQVGDPFTEKLLIEACLELMEGDAIVAIQDMGAAGLTSSSVEMAGKGGLGIELDLDHVPVREE